jgi:hypothetical protein
MKAASSAPVSPTYQSVAGGSTPQATSVRPSAWASCSPCASVAYSFLFVVEWFRNKLHSFLRQGRIGAHNENQFVPRYQCGISVAIDVGGLRAAIR